MGINAILTPADLAKGEAITPGWYPVEIVSYDETPTKGSPEKPSDGSMNAVFEMKILEGADGVKGRIMKRYFNEKALGMGKNLWAVLFNYDTKKGGPLSSEMFRSSVGKKLSVYIKRGANGKFDEISDYKPLA